MAVNKVQFGGRTLIDLTSDTVTADKLASGVKAHDASGAAIIGTMVSPNCYIVDKVLATHQSANVALCTLPDEVYAHKDDATFTVTLINLAPSSLVNYDDYYITACNNTDLPKNSNNFVFHGMGLRKSSNGAQKMDVWYPPNATNNSTSTGGIGKFWLNGKVLNYKSNQYWLGAGTLRVVVSW